MKTGKPREGKNNQFFIHIFSFFGAANRVDNRQRSMSLSQKFQTRIQKHIELSRFAFLVLSVCAMRARRTRTFAPVASAMCRNSLIRNFANEVNAAEKSPKEITFKLRHYEPPRSPTLIFMCHTATPSHLLLTQFRQFEWEPFRYSTEHLLQHRFSASHFHSSHFGPLRIALSFRFCSSCDSIFILAIAFR